MGFYTNLKIRNKLILGFSIIVFISLSTGIFSYYQIHKLERAGNFLFNKSIKPMEHISDIATDFQRLRVNIREYILASDKTRNEYYEGRVTKFRTDIDKTVKKLEETLPDAESRKLFARLVQTRSEYTPYLDRINDLSKANKDDEAMAYLQSEAVTAAEHAEIDAIENLQQYLVANAENISDMNTSDAETTRLLLLLLSFGALLMAAIMTILITRSIVSPLRKVLDSISLQQKGDKEKARLVTAIADGDLDQELIISDPLKISADQINRDETGVLLKAIIEMSEVQYLLDQAFAEMTCSLRHSREQEALRDWYKNGQNELNTILRGDKSTPELTEHALAFITEYLGAGVGVFYVFDEKNASLKITASYALTKRKRQIDMISLGEGLAGQAALEKRMITLDEAPPDYLRISSGLGESEPTNIIALPLLHNGTLVGLLEIGSFTKFGEDDFKFLKQIMEALAIAISVNRSRQLVNDLLEQTQGQAEELRVQQEELQQTNEELEERAQMLEQQREQIRAKNREVEEASRELQRKADELQQISTYKSEFLANMIKPRMQIYRKLYEKK